MKRYSIILLCFVGVCVYVHTGIAQLETWPDKDLCGLFHYNTISDMPPVNPSMPWEVLVGYIALDSLFRTATVDDLIHRLEGMPKDSLLIGLRYWFKMLDYDPLLEREFRMASSEWPGYKMDASGLYSIYQSLFLSVYGDWDELDAAVLFSEYIHHVRVEAVSTREIYRDEHLNSIEYCATIVPLEKMVGQIIPNACLYAGESDESPTQCMEIVWRREPLEHCTNPDDSAYSIARGDSLFLPGEEYIVFLGYNNRNVDSNGVASDITTQCGSFGGVRWVYKVSDGYVVDADNVFGLGTEVPLTEFIQNIYNKRIQLLSE